MCLEHFVNWVVFGHCLSPTTSSFMRTIRSRIYILISHNGGWGSASRPHVAPSFEERLQLVWRLESHLPCELQPVAELLHLLHHLHAVGFVVRKVVPGLLWGSKVSRVRKFEGWPRQRGQRLNGWGRNLAGGPEFLPLLLDGLLLDLLLLLGLLRRLLGLLLFLLLQQTSSFQLRLPRLREEQRTQFEKKTWSMHSFVETEDPRGPITV